MSQAMDLLRLDAVARQKARHSIAAWPAAASPCSPSATATTNTTNTTTTATTNTTTTATINTTTTAATAPHAIHLPASAPPSTEPRSPPTAPTLEAQVRSLLFSPSDDGAAAPTDVASLGVSAIVRLKPKSRLPHPPDLKSPDPAKSASAGGAEGPATPSVDDDDAGLSPGGAVAVAGQGGERERQQAHVQNKAKGVDAVSGGDGGAEGAGAGVSSGGGGGLAVTNSAALRLVDDLLVENNSLRAQLAAAQRMLAERTDALERLRADVADLEEARMLYREQFALALAAASPPLSPLPQPPTANGEDSGNSAANGGDDDDWSELPAARAGDDLPVPYDDGGDASVAALQRIPLPLPADADVYGAAAAAPADASAGPAAAAAPPPLPLPTRGSRQRSISDTGCASSEGAQGEWAADGSGGGCAAGASWRLSGSNFAGGGAADSGSGDVSVGGLFDALRGLCRTPWTTVGSMYGAFGQEDCGSGGGGAVATSRAGPRGRRMTSPLQWRHTQAHAAATSPIGRRDPYAWRRALNRVGGSMPSSPRPSDAGALEYGTAPMYCTLVERCGGLATGLAAAPAAATAVGIVPYSNDDDPGQSITAADSATWGCGVAAAAEDQGSKGLREGCGQRAPVAAAEAGVEGPPLNGDVVASGAASGAGAGALPAAGAGGGGAGAAVAGDGGDGGFDSYPSFSFLTDPQVLSSTPSVNVSFLLSHVNPYA